MQTVNTLGMRVLTDGALASTGAAPLRPSATVLTTTVYSTPDWICVMLKLYTLCKKQQTNKQTKCKNHYCCLKTISSSLTNFIRQAVILNPMSVCFVPLYCLRKVPQVLSEEGPSGIV